MFVDDLSVCGLEGQIYEETGVHIAAPVNVRTNVDGNLEATMVTERIEPMRKAGWVQSFMCPGRRWAIWLLASAVVLVSQTSAAAVQLSVKCERLQLAILHHFLSGSEETPLCVPGRCKLCAASSKTQSEQ